MMKATFLLIFSPTGHGSHSCAYEPYTLHTFHCDRYMKLIAMGVWMRMSPERKGAEVHVWVP